jgi:hypothetical protein
MGTMRSPTLRRVGSRYLRLILFVACLALQGVPEPQSPRPAFRSEFRYVVLSDEVYDMTGAKDLTRNVQVLMDDKGLFGGQPDKTISIAAQEVPGARL